MPVYIGGKARPQIQAPLPPPLPPPPSGSYPSEKQQPPGTLPSNADLLSRQGITQIHTGNLWADYQYNRRQRRRWKPNLSPGEVNPYAGIEGIDPATIPMPSDQLSGWTKKYRNRFPGTGDYPTRERAEEIGQATLRLAGFNPMQRTQSRGTGVGLEDYPDYLRRLLQERLYGGGSAS